MDSLRLLCLLAMLFCVAEQIAGQAPKMLGEWSSSVANQYPNPLGNDVKCNVNGPPMRICDPNEVLDGNQRNGANAILQEFGNSTFQQITNCHSPGVFVVALLKSIAGDAHDKGQETVRIAEQFRQIWPLNNCSAVFVVSSNDKASGLVLGDTLKQLLPDWNTTSINSSSSICFTGNKFQGELATLIQCLGNAFTEEIGKRTASQTEESPLDSEPTNPPKPNDSDRNISSSANHPLIGSILFVLVALLLL